MKIKTTTITLFLYNYYLLNIYSNQISLVELFKSLLLLLLELLELDVRAIGTWIGELIIEFELDDALLNRLLWCVLFDITFKPVESEVEFWLNWIAWKSFCDGIKPFVRLFELALIDVLNWLAVELVIDDIWFSWCCWMWWKFWKFVLLFKRNGLFSSFSFFFF